MIGVGLIGASFAKAGSRSSIFGRTVGYSRTRATAEEAFGLGLIDEIATDLVSEFERADLIFIATPVDKIADYALMALRGSSPSTLVTDGGSVKAPIIERVEREAGSELSARFIGGHPIAGKEKSGPSAASARLYEGSCLVLTPTDRSAPEMVSKSRDLWEALGSRVALMKPEEHDEALALTSHLPHLAAYGLVDTFSPADGSGRNGRARLVAGGFKSMTRIAASDPEMWRAIFELNREQVLTALGNYKRALERYESMIERRRFDDLERAFLCARGRKLDIDRIEGDEFS